MSDFPVFARHKGVWEGSYTLLDRDGNVLDRHKSRLEIEMDEPKYFQRNIYTWDDGRSESIEFPGEFRDGRLWFDTPRLEGSAVEVDDDIIVLTWHYKDKPADSLGELIRLLDDNNRVRTWQFVDDGQFKKVMVIQERKVSDTV